MTKKKPEPNPIEQAIGDRAKHSIKKPIEEITQAEELTPPIPQDPAQIPDEPSPQEMLTLEELNRQTEARLQDQYPEEEQVEVIHTVPKVPIIPVPKKTIKDVLAETIPTPVSKLDRLPVTKTSSPESPPQMIDNHDKHVEVYNKTAKKLGIPQIEKEFHPVAKPIGAGIDKLPPDFKVKHTYDTGIAGAKPAEDIELTNLRKYILEDGFVLATVAFHIVSLCAQPMTTPSTTMWDFKDRAMIPDMVLALLNQPGYIEGIWPSLKIVMADNKGNSAWCAGIATTIAFFDVVRTLPAIEELKNDS